MSENMNITPPPAVNTQYQCPFGFDIASIGGVKTPFAFRKYLAEDNILLQSIFVSQEYALPIHNFQPNLILDLGGNIGCSAVYFTIRYPNAQIYSVEPGENNFKLLSFNTVLYDNIHAIKSAVWDKETFIKVEDRGYGQWGLMTIETAEDDPEAFRTVTIAKLLRESGFDEIDLLKIDIEGAEKEVFSAPDVHEWLSKVKVLTIELHDRMKRGCSTAFFKAVSEHEWFFTFRGENLILIRENLI